MRPIHLVDLDKVRPAVILTRELSMGAMSKVTIAPITSRIRGLQVEVPVGAANGLDQESVVNCDDVQTVPVQTVGRVVGMLFEHEEPVLARALIHAFDLRLEDLPR